MNIAVFRVLCLHYGREGVEPVLSMEMFKLFEFSTR